MKISTPSRPIRIWGLDRIVIYQIYAHEEDIPGGSEELLAQLYTDACILCTDNCIAERHFDLENVMIKLPQYFLITCLAGDLLYDSW